MLSIAAFGLAAAVAVPAAALPAKDRPIVMTSLTIGESDPNGKVPTINGVPGSGTVNWDVSLPVAAMIQGRRYHVTATFHDLSYTGTCNAHAVLTRKQGHDTVTLRDVPLGPANCAAGNVYLLHADFGTTPEAPGPATLAVTLFYGDTKATMKVPMTIGSP